MTHIISLDVPVAYALADLFENKSEELSAQHEHLNHRWHALAASWDGHSKHQVEQEVHSLLGYLRQLQQQTSGLGGRVRGIARRFDEADQSIACEVTRVIWSGSLAALGAAAAAEAMAIAEGMQAQAEQPITYEELIETVRALEKRYYDQLGPDHVQEVNAIVSSILVRSIYEKEFYWPWFIDNKSMHLTGESDLLAGLDKDITLRLNFDTDKLVNLGDGRTVNMDHVLVGLAAFYQPNGPTDLINGTIHRSLIGDSTNMAYSTYVGDLGGAVNSTVAGKGTLQSQYHGGLIQKFDLEGDVDAHAISRMLTADPKMHLSDALDTYYHTDNPYRQQRFSNFVSDLQAGQTVENAKLNLSRQTALFALEFRLKDAAKDAVPADLKSLQAIASNKLNEIDSFILGKNYVGQPVPAPFDVNTEKLAAGSVQAVDMFWTDITLRAKEESGGVN